MISNLLIGLICLKSMTLKVYGIISVALFSPLLISLLPLSLRHLLHTANRILCNHIKKLLSRKIMFWRAWRASKTRILLNRYKDCARECRHSAREYSDIEVNIICSNKIANFYKYANRKLACKSGIGGIKDSSGELMSDPFTQVNHSMIFLDQCLLLTMALCRISSNDLLKMFQYQILDLLILVF